MATSTVAQMAQAPIILSSIPSDQYGVTEEGVALRLVETLYLSGGHLPHISLSRTISMQASGQIIRDAKVEFWLEGKTQTGSERKITDVELVEHEVDNNKRLCLKVGYENALVAGADNLVYTWPEDFKVYIDELLQLRGSGTVYITLPSTNKRYVNELKSKIEEYQNHAPFQTLRPFYDPSEEAISSALEVSLDRASKLLAKGVYAVTAWQAMTALHSKKKLGVPAVPATNTFSSLDHANIVLANGVFPENLWEKSIVEQL